GVIVDMSVYSSAKGVNRTVLEENGVQLEAHIYEKHQIDSAQFAASNYYYTYHPETYEDIYKRVRDSLTKLKVVYTALDKKETKEKRRIDSIKRAETKLSPEEVAKKETSMNDALAKKNRKTSIKSE
ncbi:MAG: DUF4296 domain-containing protein, partial [Oceanihabitans sp.]|nr:DUF4296 domain-containing protein [Oceanihabitans sp.]